MSNLPISSKYRSQPDEPVSEAEREGWSRQLNEQFTRGAIDQDTYRQLLDQVFAARTNSDLVPVVEQLPARPTYQQPAIVAQDPAVAPGELTPARSANKLAVYAVGGGIAAAVLVVILLLLVLL